MEMLESIAEGGPLHGVKLTGPYQWDGLVRKTRYQWDGLVRKTRRPGMNPNTLPPFHPGHYYWNPVTRRWCWQSGAAHREYAISDALRRKARLP